MAARHVANDFPRLLNVSNTGNFLKASLEGIVASYGSRDEYPEDALRGLWSGPTGAAYLFLHVSVAHPKLVISGKPAIWWAREYIKGARGQLKHNPKRCGIWVEKLAFEAVRASISKDMSHVREFLSNMSLVLSGEYPDELLYGRAGALYLLRMIRHWVPNSAPLVERDIVMVTNKIMHSAPSWRLSGHRYLGAVHGDIGIITQIVLTSPPLAPQLEKPLDRLLDMQLPDGNWPSSEGHGGGALVQFCHGAPGFILSLLSLRGYFPALQDKIEMAIKKGRGCIWEQGLLRKEPSLCHGILGNALWVLNRSCG